MIKAGVLDESGECPLRKVKQAVTFSATKAPKKQSGAIGALNI